jgi:malate dehydrogenase
MARSKISLIGGGNIGGVLAQEAAYRELGDVTIFDVVEGLPQGKSLDMAEGAPILGADAHIRGTNDYKDIAGSDVVIVTAGLARKPGMSRDDLLKTNLAIMKQVATGVRDNAPNAFVIVVSNPLDAMVYELKRVTGFSGKKVVGMAGVLDSGRFQLFLAREAGVAVKDVRAMVLGGHGDTMVPVLSYCTVDGIPVRQLIAGDKLAAIADRTRNGGGEIVKLMGTSAYYAPASAAVLMATAYLKDEKRLLPAAAFLNGEYGYKDLYLGVPVVIGAGGVEKVVSIELSAEEKAMLDKSAAAVRELVEASAKL